MDLKKVIKSVVENAGGKENISSITHCATRLRIELQDETKYDRSKLEDIEGVKGVFFTNGQLQIIFGSGLVQQVFRSYNEVFGDNVSKVEKENVNRAKPKGNIAQRFVKMLSDIFVPIIPAIVAGGLLMGINNILTAKDIFFAGKTLIEARRYLDELNIDIQRIDYMPTDNIQEDTVLAVYPKAGKKVGITTKISLLVSSKSLIDNTTMPNLIGLDKNEATKILAQIGLKINLISDAKDPSFPQNAIIATNPLPGSRVNKNTNISIVLNTGIEVNKSIDDIIQEEKFRKMYGESLCYLGFQK